MRSRCTAAAPADDRGQTESPSHRANECGETVSRKPLLLEDLDAAVARADVIAAATSASTSVIRGECVRVGTHVDLVGGYRLDMQEADCDVFRGARIFVDDRQIAVRSGDIRIPL